MREQQRQRASARLAALGGHHTRNTDAEMAVRAALEARRVRFIAQAFLLNRFVVDFLVGHKVIEVDGALHRWKRNKIEDEARDANLASAGVSVSRIANDEVPQRLGAFLDAVLAEEAAKMPTPEVPTSAWTGRKHTEEAKAKMRAAAARRREAKGKSA